METVSCVLVSVLVLVAEADVTPHFFPPLYTTRTVALPSTTPYIKDFLRLNATANDNLPPLTTNPNVDLLHHKTTHRDGFLPSPPHSTHFEGFPSLAPIHQQERFLPLKTTTQPDDFLRLGGLRNDDYSSSSSSSSSSSPFHTTTTTTQPDYFSPFFTSHQHHHQQQQHQEDIMPLVTPDNNNLDDFDLVGMVDAGESIPTLFHRLINTGLDDIDSSEASLLAAEERILKSDDQHILAAVISTGGSPEKTSTTTKTTSSSTTTTAAAADRRSSKSYYPLTGEGVQEPTKSRSESVLPRQGWVLLSYKKKDQQTTPPPKEQQQQQTSDHQIQTWEDWPIEKLPRQQQQQHHHLQSRQKQSKEKVSNEHQQYKKPDERRTALNPRGHHHIGKRSPKIKQTTGHHKRQKRFTFKNKLRSIAVPLSVFNFLGFLPVRVPGLPYHNDLPSPDYSYYNTMHEVYVPQHYRRRKGYYRYY
ncbi:hypothetical protein Pmani_005362 [Petrolisthes manimaculis]|uniref:Uncharacterized protein n=1 Tax=Petrolisthes manimaculis TaxID=1843537 RepID=A0AAE1UM95_9EUCA|nr:hypothetical protein Pmani_005362 [Petrolisthes manimaculis]